MVSDRDLQSGFIFQSLIKEAEFVRSETILCIDKVRQLTVYATSIAGFALPVIASLIVVKDGSALLNSTDSVMQAVEKNHLVIQFICIAISMTCVAFLRIYVGLFKQIFTFAKYFRDHIAPSINTHSGSPDIKLFYWEEWLKSNRSKKSFFIGDIDLAAEPILMGIYITMYSLGFIFIAHRFNSFPITSYALGAIVAISLFSVYQKFTGILESAATN